MEHHSLEWIDEASSREEFEGRYDEWGSTYDTDLVVAGEYKLPSFIGDLFMKYAQDRNARILDAGAGTGLGGAYINRHGYNNLTGIDMSQGMLAEAERKGIYRTLERMVLGKVLDFADDYFDAVLSVGTIGHAPPESFDELIRITRPSGHIVFSIRTTFHNEPRFHRKLKSLEEAGKWRRLEKTEPFPGLPGEAPDAYYYGFVYEVL